MTKEQVEYCGPPNQEWLDEEGQKHTLIAGRRYSVSPALATYMVECNGSHWKRPDPPKGKAPAADKE